MSLKTIKEQQLEIVTQSYNAFVTQLQIFEITEEVLGNEEILKQVGKIIIKAKDLLKEVVELSDMM